MSTHSWTIEEGFRTCVQFITVDDFEAYRNDLLKVPNELYVPSNTSPQELENVVG